MLFDGRGKAGDDVGVNGGNLVGFGGVYGEVEEERLRVLGRLGVAVGTLRNEVDLPVAEAGGAEYRVRPLLKRTDTKTGKN